MQVSPFVNYSKGGRLDEGLLGDGDFDHPIPLSNLIDNRLACLVLHTTKNRMNPIQPRRFYMGDEEL